jgi:hypothetical protein
MAVMNLWVPLKAANFVANSTFSFSGRAVFYEVRSLLTHFELRASSSFRSRDSGSIVHDNSF